MSAGTRVRPVRDADWPGVAAVEAAAYAGTSLVEGRAALESKGRISPDTCFVLDRGGRIAGYLLALPYPPFRFPDLARPEAAAHRAANLHLHDLAVVPELRGRGWGGRLLARLTSGADPGWERVSLVAVGGMAGFWASRGFRAHPEVPVPPDYGAGAVYMSLALPGSSDEGHLPRESRAEPRPAARPQSRAEPRPAARPESRTAARTQEGGSLPCPVS